MAGMLGYLIVLSCLANPAQPGSKLAEKLATKTISDFLANLNSLPADNAHRVLAINQVIELARSTPGNCLQKDEKKRCTWSIQKASPPSSGRVTREVGFSTKASTKNFIISFIKKLATKSFPSFQKQILSVFSNETESFLPSATDTVKRLQVSSNLLVLRTIQKMQQTADKLTDLKIPILTVTSILLVLVLCLVGSCIARQIDMIRQRKSSQKQKKLDDYFNRRQMREQLNATPAYEQVALQLE